MTTEQENIISIFTSKENAQVIQIIKAYDKVSGIIERTHIAMGKKRKFTMSSSSSGSDKIIANATPSTH